MDKTIKLHNKAARLATESSRSSINHISAAVRPHAAQFGGGLFVKRELAVTIMETEDARRAVYRKEKISKKSSVNIKLVAECIGENGIVPFFDLL